MKNLMIFLCCFFIAPTLFSQSNAIKITNDGKMGIGTLSPSELLEVEGGSGGGFFGISIKQNTNNVGYPSLFFNDVSDNVLASIFPHQTKTHLYFRLNSGDFIFDRFSGSSPQMSLKENGNLGIGTTTPDEKLHVAGGVRIDGALEDKDGDAGIAGQILSSTSTGTDWIPKTDITDFANGGETGGADRSLGNTDNFAISLKTNNTSRQKIFNNGGIRFDGNVGIFTDPKVPGINKAIDLYDSGTFSNPYLKISGHNSGSIELVSRRTDITNGKSWRIGSGSGSALNLDRFYIYNSDDGNVFTIREGGNIGIATDIPTAKIDINGSTGYNQLRLQTPFTPTSSSDTNGNVGDIAWDENFMYVKTNEGWKRTALVTF